MASIEDAISSFFIEKLSELEDLQGVTIIRHADESEDRGPYIVIVDAVDNGSHDGGMDRSLVDATLNVGLFGHITDDPAGETTARMHCAIAQFLESGTEIVTDEAVGQWFIRFFRCATSGTGIDGNYRKMTYSCRMILQDINA